MKHLFPAPFSYMLGSALFCSEQLRQRLANSRLDNLVIIQAAEKITRRHFIVEHESMTVAVQRVDDARCLFKKVRQSTKQVWNAVWQQPMLTFISCESLARIFGERALFAEGILLSLAKIKHQGVKCHFPHSFIFHLYLIDRSFTYLRAQINGNMQPQ